MDRVSTGVWRAVLRRDWQIERTYQLRMLMVFTEAAMLAVSLYFVSRLIDDPAALAEYGGNYFDFAIVGLAVTSFAGVGISGFSDSIVREQSTGTIELLFASPASTGGLLGGMLILPFLQAVVQVALLLGFGMGVVGSGIPLGGLVLSIPVLVLTTITFAAVGMAAAGLIMLAKRGDPISGPFYQVSMLMSGAIFPISVLPKPFEVLSLAFPATWGIRAVRELLLNDAGWSDVAPDVLVLIGFCVVMVPLGLLAFRTCLRSARRQGLIGSY